MLDVTDHKALHGAGWNREWRDFFRDFEREGLQPSKNEILAKAAALKENPKFACFLRKGIQATKNYKGWRKMAERLKGVKGVGKTIPLIGLGFVASDVKDAYDQGSPRPIVEGILDGLFGGPPTRTSED
jgi:hypothetical protein